jgi:hypothetical protein
MIQRPDSWKGNLTTIAAQSLIDDVFWLLSHTGSAPTCALRAPFHLGLNLNSVIKRMFGLAEARNAPRPDKTSALSKQVKTDSREEDASRPESEAAVPCRSERLARLVRHYR